MRSEQVYMTTAPAQVAAPSAIRGSEFELVRSAMTPSRRAVGRILVVNGSLGSGKSTLLRAAIAHRAEPKGVLLQATGASGESEMPFWGLHQLLLPLLARSPAHERLLETVMSAKSLGAQSRVDLSVMSLQLINRLVADHGLSIVIDDAQFIDDCSLDVLAFLTARLDRVSMVLGTDRGVPRQLGSSRTRELELEPLSRIQASRYVRARHPDLPDYQLECVITEADGNLLALREYGRSMSMDGLESRMLFPLFQRMPIRLLDTFAVRLKDLPAEVRRELLFGAIDIGPRGLNDPGLTRWQPSAAQLELVRDRHLAELTSAGMVFANRLIRGAVYSLASPSELRDAHAELAARYARDPSRSVFHRCATATAPDERLAKELTQTGEQLFDNGVTELALASLVQGPGSALNRQCGAVVWWRRPIGLHLLDSARPLGVLVTRRDSLKLRRARALSYSLAF